MRFLLWLLRETLGVGAVYLFKSYLSLIVNEYTLIGEGVPFIRLETEEGMLLYFTISDKIEIKAKNYKMELVQLVFLYINTSIKARNQIKKGKLPHVKRANIAK